MSNNSYFPIKDLLGGADLFSLFRIDNKLREKGKGKLEEAAERHTERLRAEFVSREDKAKKVRERHTQLPPTCRKGAIVSACAFDSIFPPQSKKS